MAKRIPIQNPEMPGTMLVPLTRGYFAIIDEADATAVGQRTWFASFGKGRRTPYAMTNGLGPAATRENPFHLHRFLWRVWGLPDTPEIDHQNRNGLDCRRENLRPATSKQNKHNTGKRSTNTTGFKGVSRGRHGVGFRARIVDGRRERSLGVYPTAEDAAAVVERVARDERGEFAHREDLGRVTTQEGT